MDSTMFDFIRDIIMSIIPIIFSGLSAYLLAKQKTNNEEKKKTQDELQAFKLGMMILMRKELRSEHDRLMKKGKVTAFELEQYMQIDAAYAGAGGNTINHELMEDVKSLDIRG